MRRSILALPLALPLVLLSASAVHAEVTRTLTVELSGDPSQAFAVENLLGRMNVVPGEGKRVVATATVHGESAELADLMRFEQVAGENGVPTLRVRYPVDKHTTYRHESGGDGLGDFLSWLSFTGGGTHLEYDGVRVRISRNAGVRLWADVEIRVPAATLDARFDNRAGPLSARGLRGKASLRARSGDVTVSESTGEISARSGSGRVSATGVSGVVAGQTGSGDCDVSDFRGDEAKCRTGSGDVRMTRVAAARVETATGSGEITLSELDAEQLSARTGSGDVHFDASGTRLKNVTARTGSGDVSMKLAKSLGFELRARTGSGDIEATAPDATPVREGQRVVGYRRGNGAVQIDVRTGSGDVRVQ